MEINVSNHCSFTFLENMNKEVASIAKGLPQVDQSKTRSQDCDVALVISSDCT